jgi:hypothetical protein
MGEFGDLGRETGSRLRRFTSPTKQIPTHRSLPETARSMPYTLELEDFLHMTQEEREAELERFFNPTDEDVEAAKRFVDVHVRKYEQRYEMSSERMREKLRNGEIRETAEIDAWLFWHSVQRDYLEEEKPVSE